MQRDAVTELFGLAGTFPRPGWVVLDAARDHRFTGELVFETSPSVRVYFDRGEIYLAERDTDPSLGARLVDAGALSAVQLERGGVRVGDVEHLGRLFERVPSLDRHAVIVTAELMTEECVGWLAAQRVPEVVSTPYRHHESGVRLWERGPDLAPGDPLPAPTADLTPVSLAPPSLAPATGAVAVGDRAESFDGLIEWDEPAWLDADELERELLEPRPGANPAADHRGVDAGDAEGRPVDWVDRLEIEGVLESDPLATPKPLARLPIEPIERFELVWPSGEIDEDFGAVESVVGNGHDPDADRVGATARLGRGAPDRSQDTPHDPMHDPTHESGEPADALAVDAAEPTDQVVLAVRRAVASIDVGSLAARQRLADRSVEFGGALDDSGEVPAPGRVAVRAGRNDWSRRTVSRSVFDEPVVEAHEPAVEPVTEPDEHRTRRAGALRRLIASFRR